MSERIFPSYIAEAKVQYIGPKPTTDRKVLLNFYEWSTSDPPYPTWLFASTNSELEVLRTLSGPDKSKSVLERSAAALGRLPEHVKCERGSLLWRNTALNLEAGKHIEYLQALAVELGIFAQGMARIGYDLQQFIEEVHDEMYLIKRQDGPDIRIVALNRKGKSTGTVIKSGVIDCAGLQCSPSELAHIGRKLGYSYHEVLPPEIAKPEKVGGERNRLLERNEFDIMIRRGQEMDSNSEPWTYKDLQQEAQRLGLLEPVTLHRIYTRIQRAQENTQMRTKHKPVLEPAVDQVRTAA